MRFDEDALREVNSRRKASAGQGLMVQEILPNLFKIEIPLRGSPLRALNSYVVKGGERHLIVDTGWNREESRAAMLAGLKEIDVPLEESDFFITHLHVDHIGLASSLVTEGTKVYFNRREAASMKAGIPWRPDTRYAVMSGFPEKDLDAMLRNHPGVKYGLKGPLPFVLLDHGDGLQIGDFEFTCLETPGHTRGHMCLYEAGRRFVLAGDHMLSDITPNIQLWSDDRNPLKDYLQSLDRVGEYPIELALPGHREIIRNCKKRIQELKTHHQGRLDEILGILGKGRKSGFEVAAEMTWDISGEYGSFSSFPVQQKWFATGEAIAHLRYLEEEGLATKALTGGRILYSR